MPTGIFLYISSSLQLWNDPKPLEMISLQPFLTGVRMQNCCHLPNRLKNAILRILHINKVAFLEIRSLFRVLLFSSNYIFLNKIFHPRGSRRCKEQRSHWKKARRWETYRQRKVWGNVVRANRQQLGKSHVPKTSDWPV